MGLRFTVQMGHDSPSKRQQGHPRLMPRRNSTCEYIPEINVETNWLPRMSNPGFNRLARSCVAKNLFLDNAGCGPHLVVFLGATGYFWISMCGRRLLWTRAVPKEIYIYKSLEDQIVTKCHLHRQRSKITNCISLSISTSIVHNTTWQSSPSSSANPSQRT